MIALTTIDKYLGVNWIKPLNDEELLLLSADSFIKVPNPMNVQQFNVYGPE